MKLYQVVVKKGDAKTTLTPPKPILDAQASLGRLKANMELAEGNELVIIDASTGEEYNDSTPNDQMTITT